jgi:aminoglycoside phosphotransferase (APT) family kinase protein
VVSPRKSAIARRCYNRLTVTDEHHRLWDELAAAAPAPIVMHERAHWGFGKETLLLTLSSQQRMVAQFMDAPSDAQRMETAAGAFRRMGLPVPVIRVAVHGERTSAVLVEHVDGTPGPEALAAGDAAAVAESMGALARLLRSFEPAPELQSDAAWMTPAAVLAAAEAWGARSADGSTPGDLRASARTVAATRWRAVVVHGDYVPANVLMADDRVAALLDLQAATNGHPLTDAAWWGLVVRHHHRALFDVVYPRFLDGVGIEPAERACLPHVALLRAAQLVAEPSLGVPAGPELVSTALDWAKAS